MGALIAADRPREPVVLWILVARRVAARRKTTFLVCSTKHEGEARPTTAPMRTRTPRPHRRHRGEELGNSQRFACFQLPTMGYAARAAGAEKSDSTRAISRGVSW